ncbi:hypothetical protein LINGRAPRIM_LOCUS2262 [Linum grandiflorum]
MLRPTFRWRRWRSVLLPRQDQRGL